MTRRVDPVATLMAAAAFVWHLMLMTRATNDNFMHMVMAQQWLRGDWPVRDFFDNGSLLQYSLSAVAQLIFGDRLIGEATVVGLAWAISTYIVFILVRRLSGALPAAVIAALPLILAGARGYSYPKGIAYAGAVALWWAYVQRPETSRIVAFGAWVAAAYYWRADHGIYTAIGLVLATAAAHGLRREMVTRTFIGGATTVVLVLPFWIYVHATIGLPNYAQAGLSEVRTEHETHGTHVWPILRFGSRAVVVDPPDAYAPVVGLRWTSASTAAARDAVRQRYGLSTVEVDGDSERVRLSERSLSLVGDIVRDAMIEDTAGIDRSAGVLDTSDWPALQRWKFRHAWLRLQFLPELDARDRAAEFAVALFLLFPIVLVVASPWVARRLSTGVTAFRVATFGLFAFLVAFAMLREPFTARVADAVVPCAVAFALCTVWLWRAGPGRWHVRSLASRATAIVLVAFTMTTVAATGEFGSTMDGLTRHWTRNPIAGVWASITPELTASPPLSHYLDRPARITLRLAAYARGCVPATDRVLVLWFEPEIPYFSERLIAQQHLVFPLAWANVPHEQQVTLEKVSRYKPPIAFALASALDKNARAAYPGLVDYVEREYQLAVTVAEGGEDYLIFTRKDRPAAATFGGQAWPCFADDPSPWDRVGVTPGGP